VPAVLADGGEQCVQQPDVGAAPLGMVFACQVCQIAFEQPSVELADVFDADRGEELREAGDRHQRSCSAGFQSQPTGQTQSDPAFGQIPQPGLLDPAEP